MHTFTERLAERGLTATGGYSFATLPDDSTCVLMAERRTPLQDVVNRTIKKSDNLNAEALLWRIGLLSNPGKRYISAADGLKEVNMMIRRAGMNPSNYKIVDGCGLSNYDYLSPELLVAVLRYAYSKTTLFRMLYRSLPVAGVDGTLRSRMKQGKAYSNVHAKTGSYTAINALAGYLKRSDGHDVAFAIMNQNILSAAAARSFQDAVCQLLCE
jgi:D-alanyl-D-alanine carboxypeptidase/D-alanyl-D-alanine-endopeptidase (penicillin-binding protein 4)